MFETRRWHPKLLFFSNFAINKLLFLKTSINRGLIVVWQVADYQRARCDATLRVWHTQSRCTTNVKLCMHGGGLPCHHHCNFKPWAHRTTTSGTITSHGRCERVAERVHEATTTPLIANTQSHINQTENAAHANKTYCMLTNHPPPYHLHDIALVPCHARSFAEFAHKSFQAKRVCNPNTGRLVCKCTDWSTNTQTSLHGRLNHLISTSFVD